MCNRRTVHVALLAAWMTALLGTDAGCVPPVRLLALERVLSARQCIALVRSAEPDLRQAVIARATHTESGGRLLKKLLRVERPDELVQLLNGAVANGNLGAMDTILQRCESAHVSPAYYFETLTRATILGHTCHVFALIPRLVPSDVTISDLGLPARDQLAAIVDRLLTDPDLHNPDPAIQQAQLRQIGRIVKNCPFIEDPAIHDRYYDETVLTLAFYFDRPDVLERFQYVSGSSETLKRVLGVALRNGRARFADAVLDTMGGQATVDLGRMLVCARGRYAQQVVLNHIVSDARRVIIIRQLVVDNDYASIRLLLSFIKACRVLEKDPPFLESLQQLVETLLTSWNGALHTLAEGLAYFAAQVQGRPRATFSSLHSPKLKWSRHTMPSSSESNHEGHITPTPSTSVKQLEPIPTGQRITRRRRQCSPPSGCDTSAGASDDDSYVDYANQPPATRFLGACISTPTRRQSQCSDQRPLLTTPSRSVLDGLVDAYVVSDGYESTQYSNDELDD